MLAPENAAQPIDLAHLARAAGGDAALSAEVLQLFADQAAVLLQDIHAAFELGDTTRWHEIAHALKGAARAIGAFGLADAAESAEQAAHDAGAAWRALQVLQTEAGAVQIFIAAHLGR